jgi:hypothetical protein
MIYDSTYVKVKVGMGTIFTGCRKTSGIFERHACMSWNDMIEENNSSIRSF